MASLKLALYESTTYVSWCRTREIHVGADEWQSVPLHVQALGEKTSIPVTVVPGRGHVLGRDYVGGVLEGWLCVGSVA